MTVPETPQTRPDLPDEAGPFARAYFAPVVLGDVPDETPHTLDLVGRLGAELDRTRAELDGLRAWAPPIVPGGSPVVIVADSHETPPLIFDALAVEQPLPGAGGDPWAVRDMLEAFAAWVDTYPEFAALDAP